MKSAVFYGVHDVRIEESPIPKMRENEVLIRVMACGVCGTDVHIFEGDKGAADCVPPTILGHEFSGIVEKVGAEVKGICIGDRVCVDPNDLCGVCAACRGGRGHFCEHIRGIGTTVDGGFAQYCAVPYQQVYRLAPDVTFVQGAMAEPLACCLHGIDLCELRPGAGVVVIGGGLIGQIMLQLAKLTGAAKTALVEFVSEKRELGKKLGADLCIDPQVQDIKETLAAAGFGRVDAVIECAGAPKAIEQAIDIADKQSVVMMFGLTKPEATIAVKPFVLFQKEVVLKASYINPYTQERAVALLNEKRLKLDDLVYEVSALEKLPQILSDASLRAKGKYVINPWS